MTFNYALEKKKFDAAWESLRKFYTESGMEPEAIEAMHEYDWDAFKAARIEALHTQELKLPPDMDDESEAPESPLMKKFGKQLEYAVKGEYSHAVIMGGDEYARGVVRVKNLNTREEKEVAIGALIEALK